jgi:hypothetical protein
MKSIFKFTFSFLFIFLGLFISHNAFASGETTNIVYTVSDYGSVYNGKTYAHNQPNGGDLILTESNIVNGYLHMHWQYRGDSQFYCSNCPVLRLYYNNPIGQNYSSFYTIGIPVTNNSHLFDIDIQFDAIGYTLDSYDSISQIHTPTRQVVDILPSHYFVTQQSSFNPVGISSDNPEYLADLNTQSSRSWYIYSLLGSYGANSIYGFPYENTGLNISASPFNSGDTGGGTSVASDFLYVRSPLNLGTTNNQVSFNGSYNSSGAYNVIKIHVTNNNPDSTYVGPVDFYYDVPINNPPLVLPITGQDWYKTVNLPNGSYTGSIKFYDSISSIYATNSDLISNLNFTVSDGVAPAPASFFKSQESCGALDVPCALRNGFASLGSMFTDIAKYLFVPNNSFLDLYKNAWTSVSTHVPFVYLDYMLNYWHSIATGGSGSVTSLSVNIGGHSLTYFSPSLLSSNPIASMIRDFLTTACYLLFVWSAYKRAVTLFDSNSIH